MLIYFIPIPMWLHHVLGKLGWCRETGMAQWWSACLPRVWHGFDLAWCHMWIEFAIGTRHRGFFSGLSRFPPSWEINISKFQFNLDRGPAWKQARADVTFSLNIAINRFIFCLDYQDGMEPFSIDHYVKNVFKSLEIYKGLEMLKVDCLSLSIHTCLYSFQILPFLEYELHQQLLNKLKVNPDMSARVD